MKRQLLSWLGFGLLLVTGTLVLLALRELRRGEDALARSDAAFHAGDLLGSMHEARAAALCFVPGAEHVRAAEARLEAIARGAEAEGNRELARRAWDALRLVAEETDYLGRAPNAAGERARAALTRLDAMPAPGHF